MQISRTLEKLPSLELPIGLTIGTFDGMHLGHQALFQRLRNQVGEKGSIAALTFSNHPTEIFNRHNPTPLLCTLDHKLKLLQDLRVDLVILIEFNGDFAGQSFDVFLQKIKQCLPFSYLALGEGASFGKDRQGGEQKVKDLSQTLDFQVEYIPKLLLENAPVSSGRIRSALQQGKFSDVAAMLSRPYSIFAPLTHKNDHFEIHLPNLCLPPDGIYPVRANALNQLLPAKAQVFNAQKTVRLDFLHPIPSFTKTPIEIFF